MTGRELIMYILSNSLEDEPVFKDGVFVGYMSIEDAAVEKGVGHATICAMIAQGQLECIGVKQGYFIPINFRKENNGEA